MKYFPSRKKSLPLLLQRVHVLYVYVEEEILPSSSVEDTCTVCRGRNTSLPTVEDTCTVYVEEEILPSSTVEDTCIVYLKKGNVGIDIAEIKSKLSR